MPELADTSGKSDIFCVPKTSVDVCVCGGFEIVLCAVPGCLVHGGVRMFRARRTAEVVGA